MRSVTAADLFCGAGGTSTGLRQACDELQLKLQLVAINHWPTAIDTHSQNHPDVKHVCAAIESVEPRSVVPSGRLDLLVASPECTHHSSARGGKPMSDQKRASAYLVLRWAESLRIGSILIENVPEFRGWGPLGVNGKPLKSKKGTLYQHFLAGLRALGYTVEDRILNAADYGAATTRRRLFILARLGRSPVTWPAPTHSSAGGRTLFGRTAKWRPAREIIDWSIPGQSIFTRKRPLKPATMRRILAGLEKFGGPELRPFLVTLRNHMAGRSLDVPIPTVSAGGQHVGLCEPFLLHVTHSRDGARVHGLDDPMPTITTAHGGELALCEPFVLQQQSGGVPRSVDDPVPTVAAKGAIALVEPFIVGYHDDRYSEPRVHSVDNPLPTATTENRFALAEPFIVPFLGERDGQLPRVRSVDEPLHTVTTKNPIGLVEPFLVKYNGTATARSVDEPVDTIPTKDRFGLVTGAHAGYALDIRFRMLQPHELGAAMSFPREYVFTGTKGDAVRQIGNAVDVRQARALCLTLLEHLARRRPTVVEAIA
jgi:DNA (cytosine-5)-methyltransferase 1